MRKIILRIVAVIMVATMLFALLAGCKKDDEEGLYVPPEFVFVAQSVPIPSDVGDVGDLVYHDGKVYFTTNAFYYDEATDASTNAGFLYSMNLDGSAVSKLPNYAHSVPMPPGAVGGGTSVGNMRLDSQGSLWISEYWSFYGYSPPDDFDPENDSIYNYYEDYGSGTVFRKLDSTGAELLAVDTSPLQDDSGTFYASAWGVDSPGNLYLATYNDAGGMRIHAFDGNGNKQFQVDTDDLFDQFYSLPDGTIAFTFDSYNEASNSPSSWVQEIDFAAKALGARYAIPDIRFQVFPGGGGYDILFTDVRGNLYGYTFAQELGEPVKLLNWLDSDIATDNVKNIIMLSEEQIICVSSTFNYGAGDSVSDLLVLTKTPYAELPEKTVLTLATFDLSFTLRDVIVQFNRTNPNYRIQVIDYRQFSTDDDWSAGLSRLSTEIISGRVPDILEVSNLPYDQYVARGLLADLYTLLDGDQSISRSDLVQGALRAAEIDGKLYQIFTSFYVTTMVGNPNVLGPEPGWTMDEFSDVLEAHPNADMPAGQWLTRMNMLQSAVAFALDDYIDWAEGKVHFDTPQFIHLLELCMRFPDSYEYSEDDWVSQEEAVATGRQIMNQATLGSFSDNIMAKQMFGGEVVYKGFPNESRSGNSLNADFGLALVDSSPNKDAGWAFIRIMLDDTWQLANVSWGFPTSQVALDKKAQDALDAVSPSGSVLTYSDVTQADIDQIKALIDSVANVGGWELDEDIWTIVSEGASDYFSGVNTAENVARIIQSRVAILVSERSW